MTWLRNTATYQIRWQFYFSAGGVERFASKPRTITYAMSVNTKNTSNIQAMLCKVPITVRYTSNVQRSKRGQACKFAKTGIFSNFNLFQFAKMSRKTRLYDSGTLFHVILRGNGGQHIFFDNSDSRRFYQSSIGNLLQSGKWQILSIEMILLSVVECISVEKDRGNPQNSKSG